LARSSLESGYNFAKQSGRAMTRPTAADFIREYLKRMADIRGTGGATKETSYYSALENLLNSFGQDLKPQVICNGQLRNDGAGNPDFGLYSRSQVQNGEPRPGQIPERGVIEVKGLAEHTWQTADSAQATKYFGHYAVGFEPGLRHQSPKNGNFRGEGRRLSVNWPRIW
jgi:hypothetical protein